MIFTSLVPENCTNGELRLRGGTTPREGRVEICINGIWGTICGTLWDNRDAQVVCRQLGFPSIGEILYVKFVRNTTNITFCLQGQNHFMVTLDTELVPCFLMSLVALEENKPCLTVLTVE